MTYPVDELIHFQPAMDHILANMDSPIPEAGAEPAGEDEEEGQLKPGDLVANVSLLLACGAAR